MKSVASNKTCKTGLSRNVLQNWLRFKEKVSFKWSVECERAKGSVWSEDGEKMKEIGWMEREAERNQERQRDRTKTLLLYKPTDSDAVCPGCGIQR